MSFNPDPTKSEEEIIFSHKRTRQVHPPLFCSVKQVNDHKHHHNNISETVSKALKGCWCHQISFLLCTGKNPRPNISNVRSTAS